MRLKSGYEKGAHFVTLEIETLLFERCERTVPYTLCGPGKHFGNAALNSQLFGLFQVMETVLELLSTKAGQQEKRRKLEHNLNCPFSKSLPDSPIQDESALPPEAC